MKNFDRLNQAGLFPQNVRHETDLAPEAQRVIDGLTGEEIEALISSFNKVAHARKAEIQNLMPICGF
jgi:hypothetical protein